MSAGDAISNIIDFETRSECDLLAHGSWRYSKHPSTEVLCMAYQLLPGDPVYLWRPGDPFPAGLRHHIEKQRNVEAHHYGFEYDIWHHIMVPQHSWPEAPIGLWRCSAAKASCYNLPWSLEKACANLIILSAPIEL